MNIWIVNHYATNMYFNKGGRHYWFAEQLAKKGHNVTVFCSSIGHNGGESININNSIYTERKTDSFSFIFIKTTPYKGNGVDRIKNMWSFYHNFKKTAESIIVGADNKPDIIVASSVHPLTLLAGEQIAKKLKVPCICEVRDLWPEGLVETNMLKKRSIITSLLYLGEKRIYKRSDSLIFTFKYGYKYIIDKGWEKEIDLSKVYYINNGIDLDYFNKNKFNEIQDEDLSSGLFKVVYVGAIGIPNKIELIVNAARTIKNKGYEDIIFLIYGDGVLREQLEQQCINEGINNIHFKGPVRRELVPHILSKGNINLLTVKEDSLLKYGLSMNKLFDYLASGVPIVSNTEAIYSVTDGDKCGMVDSTLYKAIIDIYNLSDDDYKQLAQNSESIAKKFDYKHLTDELLNVIDNTIKNRRNLKR